MKTSNRESSTELSGDSLFAFDTGQNVKKIGGSYQATGIIMARFLADDGSPRYVFRFDTPAGLLHIFNEGQLKPA